MPQEVSNLARLRREGGKFGTMTENKQQGPCRRNRYIISKKFQQKFAFSFITLGLVIAFCVIMGLWYYSAKEVNEHLYRTHLIPSNPWNVVFPIMLRAAIIFVIMQVIASAVLTRFIFKNLSYKFKNFNSALEKLGSCDFAAPVTIESFDGLNRKLDDTRLNLNRRISVLKSIEKEIKEIAAAPVYDEKVLRDLESLSISFKNKLSKFKY
jgi:methyl-accepting chemotaxis protein